MKTKQLLHAALLGALLNTATAADFTSTYVGGARNWNDPASWTTPGAPGAVPNNGSPGPTSTYDAVQPTGTLTVDVPVTIQKLTMSGGVFGYNTGTGQTLTIKDTFTWNASYLQGTGTINAEGGATIQGSGDKGMSGGRVLNLTGITNWNAGPIVFSGAGGTITNNGDFRLNFDTPDGDDLKGLRGGTFNNVGTLTKASGTGIFPFGGTLVNTGKIQINSGTLKFIAGGTHSGEVALVAGTTMNLTNGAVHTFNLGSSITGAGTIRAQAGALVIDTPLETPAGITLRLESGTRRLDGTGTLTLNGPLEWAGGEMTGTGTTNAQAGATITTGTLASSRKLNLGSTSTWSSGNISISGTAELTLQQGASLTTTHDGSVTGFKFFNDGTFIKTTGTGITTISAQFFNSSTGKVQINSGTLKFEGTGTHSGEVALVAGTTMHLVNGAVHTFNLGSSFTGSGTIRVGVLQGSGAMVVSTPLVLPAGITLRLDNAGGTLSGDSTLTLSGPLEWAGGQMVGAGVTEALGVSTITGGSLSDTRTLNLGGSSNWTAGNITFFNSSKLTIKPGASLTTTHDGSVNTLQTGTQFLENQGVFAKSVATGTTTINVPFTNSGTVNANTGTIFFNSSYTQTAGALVLNGGSVSGSTFAVKGGKIQGGGTISGTVTSSDGTVTIEPGIGTTTGTLAITGNLTLTTGSKLSFDLGGTTAGTQHDKITEGAGTTTSVAGVTLEVGLLGTYFPAPVDTFVVFDASTTAITDSFANGVINGSRIATTDGKGTFQVNYGTGGNADKVILSNFQSTPTSLTLDDNQIVENAPLGTVVGLLSATDPNPSATFTFSLVAGAGDTGNGQFQISGNQLQAKAVLDFETQTSFDIRLRVTNNSGGFLEQQFTIQVQDVPNPTALALSSSAFEENQIIGTAVGALSATNPPGGGDPVAFTVVSVNGSTTAPLDFAVSDSNLVTNRAFNFETLPTSFNVVVKATNQGGESAQQTFTVNVLNRGPTALALAPSSILEGRPIGTTVGTLSGTVVPEGTAISTFELVAGAGDADNALFSVDGTSIKTAAVLDHEAAPTRSIRLKATDANGETFAQSLTITVSDVAVTDLTLSGTSVLENVPAGTVIADLDAVINPADAGATPTFSIVSATPNDALSVSGNQLVTSRPLLRSAATTLAVRLRAEHLGEGYEENVTITVNANAVSLVVQNPPGTNITTLDIGDVALGSSANRIVTLRNPGPGHVFNVSIRNPVAPNHDAAATSTALATDDDLAPGESVTVDIAFTPQARSNRSSTIVFESDNALDKSLSVTGRGFGPEISVQQPLGTDLVDGAAINYGGQPIGVSLPARTFVVKNVDAATSLNSIAATITGPDAAFFVLDTQGLSTSLDVGASSSFRLSFQPDALRTYNATLSIASNDGDENPFDIPLTGEGVTPLMIAQTAYAKASNTSNDGQFGDSVAVSGNTVVVGSSQANNGGAVFVFVRDPISGAWSQQAKLESTSPSRGIFGESVAISGDTIVVGDTLEDSGSTGVNGDESNNNAQNSGAAYVFQRSGGTWTQQAYLKASNAQAGDSFGDSVSISGDTIVVGAGKEDSAATGINGDGGNNSAQNAGAAYVFQRSGVAWTQQAYLKASNTDGQDNFGCSVAISGDTVVVGANIEASAATGVNGDGSDNSLSFPGAAYVFQRSGGAWAQQAYLKASNTRSNDLFGGSVAISGDTIIVAARNEDSGSTGVNGNQSLTPGFDNSGAVYVFQRSGVAWAQQAYLKASNTGQQDQFGISVAISGDTIIVGAEGEDSGSTGLNGDGSDTPGFDNAGAAYVFQRTGGAWAQHAYLKASNTGGDDNFGFSVAISGSLMVTGSRNEDSAATGINGDGSNNNATDSGGAYIFEITPPEVIVHDGPDTGSPRLADNQAQAVDYGPTPLGIPVTRSFTIKNLRFESLTVSSITPPNGYTVVNAPLPTVPIPAQGTATFSVRLNALTLGTNSGNVTITTNDVANPDFVFPVNGEVQTLAPGSLDPRFGTGGVARVDFVTGDDRAYAMALLPDGRIAVGGRTGGTVAGTFALALLQTNGTPDLSFNGDGRVTLNPTGFLDPNEITSIAVQDGKIVVGGHATPGNLGLIPASGSFALARFQMDGTLDSTFGTSGLFVDPATAATIGGLAINASGKILVAGSLSNGSELVPYVRRLDQNGKPDAAFGNSLGIRELTRNAGESALAEDMVQNNAGEIYVGGALVSGSTVQMALWRTSAAGSELLRSTFPLAAPASGLNELVSGVAIRHDGKPVVAGRGQAVYDIRGSGDGFFAGRMTSTPTLDGSFGTGGLVTTTLNAATSNERANTVAAQPDGKLIVAGSVDGKFAIVRYESNGALDTTFGTGGKVILNLGTDGSAYKVLLDAAGDIYVAGHALTPGFAGQDFVVVKLIGSIEHEPAMTVRNGNTSAAPLITNGQTAAISYGTARVGGSTVSKSFRVENSGTAPLTIDNVTVPAGFRFSSAASTPSIVAGGNGKVTVLLPTTTLGTFSGPVSIFTNDPANGTFTFPIIGEVKPNDPPLFGGFIAKTNQGEKVQISLSKLISKVSDANGDPVNVTGFSPTSLFGATITFDGIETLLYNPPSTFFGTDQFSVTFSDGEAEIVGVVSVEVAQDPAFNPKNAPKLEMKPAGLAISFTGIPGKTYKIQRSTDLVNWTTIANATASSTGKVTFTDPSPPQPSAFYRITF